MKCHLALFIASLLFFCTGYHEMKSTGSSGYGQSKSENGNLIITFSVLAFTPESRIKRFLMLRCAEVTLESYCTYFRIVNDLSYENGKTPYGGQIGDNTHESAFEIEITQNLPETDKDYYYKAQDVVDAGGSVEIKIKDYSPRR